MRSVADGERARMTSAWFNSHGSDQIDYPFVTVPTVIPIAEGDLEISLFVCSISGGGTYDLFTCLVDVRNDSPLNPVLNMPCPPKANCNDPTGQCEDTGGTGPLPEKQGGRRLTDGACGQALVCNSANNTCEVPTIGNGGEGEGEPDNDTDVDGIVELPVNCPSMAYG